MESKNPRRVAAGKRNRAKRPPLSDDARLRLREAAHDHRPWLASTGPRTAEGKARSATNAKKYWLVSLAAISESNTRKLARTLLGQMCAMRKSLHIDPTTGELTSTADVADQLKQIFTDTSRGFSQASAGKLLQQAEASTANVLKACRQSTAARCGCCT